MKRLLLLFFLLLPAAAFSQDYEYGLGTVIGNPVGVTSKYWIDPDNALDATLSVLTKKDIYMQVSYLLHDYQILPKPEEGSLPFYYGVGLAVNSGDFGVRSVAGVEYLFADYPFGVFIELAPLITLQPEFDFSFTGGIGARYYWGREKTVR